MAGFGVVLVLQVLSLFPSGSLAATLTSERQSDKLVRSEKVISMTAGGAMVQAKPEPDELVKQKSKPIEPRETLQVKTGDQLNSKDLAKLGEEFCGYDFPLGKVGTFECALTNHSLILEESMCIEAATIAGAHTDHDSFSINNLWGTAKPKLKYQRPLGCFKLECPKPNEGQICYYFNDNGDPITEWAKQNQTISGTPVCSRSMYLNSTAPDTNGGCPDGYTIVDKENTCQNAANCMGDAAGYQFLTGNLNASEHLDYPRGCFISNEDKKVYYNAKSDLGPGKNVKGTLICNVSSTVSYAGNGAVRAGNSTGGGLAPAPAAKAKAKAKAKNETLF